MRYRYLLGGPVLAALLVATGSAQAGAPLPDFDLPPVCESGPTIEGTLTIIVDDNIEDHRLGPCGRLTVLLEIRTDGELHFLAQTYECGRWGDSFVGSEMGLNQSVADASVLNRLLFLDLGDLGHPFNRLGDMAQALRDLFGVVGRPVVVGTPQRIESVEHSDHEADDLASVLRLEIEIRFVCIAQ